MSTAVLLDSGGFDQSDRIKSKIPTVPSQVSLIERPLTQASTHTTVSKNLDCYNNYLGEEKGDKYPFKRQLSFWFPIPDFANNFPQASKVEITISLRTPYEEIDQCGLNSPLAWEWELDVQAILKQATKIAVTVLPTDGDKSWNSIVEFAGSWIGSTTPALPCKLRVDFRSTTADIPESLTHFVTFSIAMAQYAVAFR